MASLFKSDLIIALINNRGFDKVPSLLHQERCHLRRLAAINIGWARALLGIVTPPPGQVHHNLIFAVTVKIADGSVIG
jgi:hypothetical protein